MTDGTLNIGPGDVVSGLDPSELVEIQRIAPFSQQPVCNYPNYGESAQGLG